MFIGSAGIVASTVMEIITREKVYLIMMKVFPWLLAVGAIIWSLG